MISANKDEKKKKKKSAELDEAFVQDSFAIRESRPHFENFENIHLKYHIPLILLHELNKS